MSITWDERLFKLGQFKLFLKCLNIIENSAGSSNKGNIGQNKLRFCDIKVWHNLFEFDVGLFFFCILKFNMILPELPSTKSLTLGIINFLSRLAIDVRNFFSFIFHTLKFQY